MTNRPHEKDFARIAAGLPQFAGYFIQNGRFVVRVTDLEVAAVARAAVDSVVNARSFGSSVQQDIVVRKADYSYAELSQWRDALSPEVLRKTGAVLVDLDEQQNRVVVGVETASDAQSIQTFISLRGVPPEAVFIEAVGKQIEDSHDLTDRFDTVPGGVRIRYDSSGTTINCSLGFNAKWGSGGTLGFVTNSHCSPKYYELDYNEMHQVLTGTAHIGTEAFDPDGSGSCGDDCRWSDAAFYDYENRPDDFGYIARTVDSASTSGSLQIDHATPRFEISGEYSNPVDGETVHKVGQSTGWTYGQVTRTCVDTQRNGFTLKCQDFADYGRQGGDSGAPVFSRDENGFAWILGVHNGRQTNTGEAIFSATANIEEDFGGVNLIAGPVMH